MVADAAGRTPAAGPAPGDRRSTQVEELCEELAAQLRGRGPGLPAGQGRRRLALPEPPGPAPPTSSGSCSRASRPGCRPPPSRRWPSWPTSSRSPGPRSPPSAASTSTASCARCSSGATSPRSAGTPARARPCCSAPRRLFLERLGLNTLDELPPLGDFVPGADVVEALEQGLRVDAGDDDPRRPVADAATTTGRRRPRRRPDAATRRRPTDARPRSGRGDRPGPGRRPRARHPGVSSAEPPAAVRTRASGCRRSWPGPASAAGGSART